MSAQRIYSLIDDILNDLDNAPSVKSKSKYSTNAQQQQQQPSKPQTNDTNNNQKGRKKQKKKIKQKNKKQQSSKPKQVQKASKRAAKLTAVQTLPDPEFKNGIKSTLLEDMQSTYNSHQVEWGWNQWWDDKGYYTPKVDKEKTDKNQKNFVMVIPPPNVTGSLHLGHALMATIEDTITRYQRMKGKNCLWLPGTDHAGIATQTVVERKLAREGKTRHDLGREEFIKKVWEWKQQKGGKICDQLRKMGCSVDWSREVFTMDDKLSKAVKEAFVRLYQEGYIYRDNRLCHWSCSLQSAISDVEIDKIEVKEFTKLLVPGYQKAVQFGILHEFKYKVIGSDEEVTIATTRLETMLGDTAVAVHPEDQRYTHLHGKFVQHPFIPDRKMPIITDSILVDMSFGTGCVKITPAHDHNDFECGKRHNLEFINILNGDGTINENGGKFAGMKRYDARRELVAELTKLGLFVGTKGNDMVIDQCSRSKDIIEPLIKPQWYMNCDDLAQRSLDAVFKQKTLTILPQKEGEQQWQYFLGNIRRWCISRQLWWGHRIPAYKITFDSTPTDWDQDDWKLNWIVTRTQEEAKIEADKRIKSKYGAKAGGIKYRLEQDEDVLDTWFSSGLFPFSTMGWPDNTDDLQSFFPGDLLETGGDIIFFWVARMVMMSFALMDKLPFHTVYLHPMVRDEYGKKMSKSSGNVIDPLHIINGVSLETLIEELHGGNIREDKIAKFEKQKRQKFGKTNGIAPCGADALRFGLSSLLVQRSINLNINTVIGYRMFCNKIWQSTKFALSYFGESSDDEKSQETHIDYNYLAKFLENNPKASMTDRWILSRLNQCITKCEDNNQKYEFGYSTQAIYQFFYHEFCATYLEAIKPLMWSKEKDSETGQKIVRDVLYICLRESYKMMHPFMPFLTEELFQRIKKARYGNGYQFGDESIINASYPDKPIKSWDNPEIERGMELAKDIAASIRSTKQSQLGLSTKTKYKVYLSTNNAENKKLLQLMADDINTLSLSESVEIFDANKQKEDDYFTSTYDVREEREKTVGVAPSDNDDESKNNADVSMVSLYSVKEIVDTIKIYSDVKGIVNVEQRMKKFNKEIGKLQKLIEKAKKSLERIDKEDIYKKQKDKLKGYEENLKIYQDAIAQLQKLC